MGEGWFPDPTGRHEFRYWTGTAWSHQVSDRGQVGVDPPTMPPLADLLVPEPVSPTISSPVPPPPPPGAAPGAATEGALPMPPPPPPPPAPPPPKVEPAIVWGTVIGAVIAGVSAFLAWFDFGGLLSVGAFDVPFVFLFDRETFSDADFSVGIVVVGLSALALLAAFVKPARLMGRMMGVLLVAVGAMFGAQVIQLANEGDLSITDVAGFGPVATIIGGVMVLITSHN
jgi:Protein of unknown function (DUF2510)